VKLRYHRGLLLASATIRHQGIQLELTDVLVDTGSSGTMIKRDLLLNVGIEPTLDDTPSEIRGVGAVELVFIKRIEHFSVGQFLQQPFRIQISRMNYGVPINGIIGLDFLMATQTLIDLKNLEIRKSA
jgi:hypothetical protein